MECTIDNDFNLRALVLLDLGKIIVIFYLKDLRLKFEYVTSYNKLKSLEQTSLVVSAYQHLHTFGGFEIWPSTYSFNIFCSFL